MTDVGNPDELQVQMGKAIQPQHETPEVRSGLAVLLPDLRGFARFLTRDTTAADDLVQETVLRALGSAGQFVVGSNLKAWLFTIQRNIFYEGRRRHVREVAYAEQQNHVQEDVREDVVETSDNMLDLSAMLWRLPELLREALILVGAQELTYEEASRICGVPVGTMKARVSRARSQLVEMSRHRTATAEMEEKPEI